MNEWHWNSQAMLYSYTSRDAKLMLVRKIKAKFYKHRYCSWDHKYNTDAEREWNIIVRIVGTVWAHLPFMKIHIVW